MKIKAKVSFCGAFSMAAGEVRTCNDIALVTDLLRAGYVDEIDEPVPEPVKEPAPAAVEKKPAKKRTTKKG